MYLFTFSIILAKSTALTVWAIFINRIAKCFTSHLSINHLRGSKMIWSVYDPKGHPTVRAERQRTGALLTVGKVIEVEKP